MVKIVRLGKSQTPVDYFAVGEHMMGTSLLVWHPMYKALTHRDPRYVVSGTVSVSL